MPSVTLPQQDGASCAAHCTVVAIQELLNKPGLTKSYAEGGLWNQIKFRANSSEQGTEHLAAEENSDPRRIVTEIKWRWPGIGARLLFDDTEKEVAFNNLPDQLAFTMGGLYEILKGTSASGRIAPEKG